MYVVSVCVIVRVLLQARPSCGASCALSRCTHTHTNTKPKQAANTLMTNTLTHRVILAKEQRQRISLSLLNCLPASVIMLL